MGRPFSLRHLRKSKGWTQAETARRLQVSQPYFSLLESGVRQLTPALSRRLQRALNLPASFLAVPESLRPWGPVTNDVLARRLAALGYMPLAYLRLGARQENPAAVLLWALGAQNVEPRLLEALPWVLLHFPELDTHWLVRECKLANLQNRLGFLVSVAKEIAGSHPEYAARWVSLAQLEATLDDARLVREDTLCEDAMSSRMRQATRLNRSSVAAHWNLVTGWKMEHFCYDA